jgi:undecaprenyl-diphosphatase
MTEEIKYFLLGLIQGLAEFFPVSSSGHIILLSSVLDIIEKDPLLLSITVHFATTLSTIIVYRKKISQLFMGVLIHKDCQQSSYLLKILISSLPLIIVGLFFKNDVELVFNNSNRLVSIMLIITAGILISTKFFNTGEKKSIIITHFVWELCKQ